MWSLSCTQVLIDDIVRIKYCLCFKNNSCRHNDCQNVRCDDTWQWLQIETSMSHLDSCWQMFECLQRNKCETVKRHSFLCCICLIQCVCYVLYVSFIFYCCPSSNVCFWGYFNDSVCGELDVIQPALFPGRHIPMFCQTCEVPSGVTDTTSSLASVAEPLSAVFLGQVQRLGSFITTHKVCLTLDSFGTTFLCNSVTGEDVCLGLGTIPTRLDSEMIDHPLFKCVTLSLESTWCHIICLNCPRDILCILIRPKAP